MFLNICKFSLYFSLTEFKFNSTVTRKHTWYDLNLFKSTVACCMVLNMIHLDIYPTCS